MAAGGSVALPMLGEPDFREDALALARLAGDPFRPRRRPTRVVRVGDVAIGGAEPIRIQSMTNTDTMDTLATVEQVTRLAEAGCEIVRVTAPSIRDAENLREIKRLLGERRVRVPLVADIHFTPNAALIAAEVVEKVRINPGNYADKKKFEIREYDDAQYREELERVASRFRPLVVRCRENGVAMRIGTNHGSLSDRILNRYGDTAEGMVESALEFLDVCEDEDYREVVFSMKASNTQVAIQAYRLLAARLERRAPGEPSYPFHVGVTEAGDAEDGRIKSAIGIGGLLEDGLGDTIRVSLTEDPVREVPVARRIALRAERVAGARAARTSPAAIEVASEPFASPFAATRRVTDPTTWGGLALAGEAPVRVELEIGGEEGEANALALPEAQPEALAARLATELSALRDVECESLLVMACGASTFDRVGTLSRELTSLGLDVPISIRLPRADAAGSAMTLAPANDAKPGTDVRLGRLVAPVDAQTTAAGLERVVEVARRHGLGLEWELSGSDDALPERVRLALASGTHAAFGLVAGASLHDYRVLAAALADAGAARSPIVLRHDVDAGRTDASAGDAEETLIDASVRLGGLLCDGIGDLVSMRAASAPAAAVDLAYRVLQGARQRTTRTEYISCPSCGRTLFDLEETTARIKASTDHLTGVKIAIMGCIVNGPGEMADADFGYVGSGPGQVTLYVGKQVVARAVPESEATDRLVELIRDHGQWVEGRREDDPSAS